MSTEDVTTCTCDAVYTQTHTHTHDHTNTQLLSYQLNTDDYVFIALVSFAVCNGHSVVAACEREGL